VATVAGVSALRTLAAFFLVGVLLSEWWPALPCLKKSIDISPLI
jgi:hypothetical protein